MIPEIILLSRFEQRRLMAVDNGGSDDRVFPVLSRLLGVVACVN